MLALLALLLTACDWPLVDATPGGTRAAVGEHVIGVATAEGLHLAWQARSERVAPVVAAGILYTIDSHVDTTGATAYDLEAFDAHGGGCAGSPPTCSPLWTAPLGRTPVPSPAVGHGLVWTNVGSYLFAFDAAGDAGCAGAPKVCDPIHIGVLPGRIQTQFVPQPPLIANGSVFALDQRGEFVGYDAAGVTNCYSDACEYTTWFSAIPEGAYTSEPVRATPSCYFFSRNDTFGVTVAGRVAALVPEITSPVVFGNRLVAEGSAGLTAMTTSDPGNCAVGYATDWVGTLRRLELTSAAVGTSRVFISASNGSVAAFDLAGRINCTATAAPRSCGPLWTGALGSGGFGSLTSPTFANGVVFVGSHDGHVYAFSGDGSTGCSGTPTACVPLWSAATTGPIAAPPTVADGYVYTVSSDGMLAAFTTGE